jgi:hypothetical protein
MSDYDNLFDSGVLSAESVVAGDATLVTLSGVFVSLVEAGTYRLTYTAKASADFDATASAGFTPLTGGQSQVWSETSIRTPQVADATVSGYWYFTAGENFITQAYILDPTGALFDGYLLVEYFE